MGCVDQLAAFMDNETVSVMQTAGKLMRAAKEFYNITK